MRGYEISLAEVVVDARNPHACEDTGWLQRCYQVLEKLVR
jgi:hypothetical protein